MTRRRRLSTVACVVGLGAATLACSGLLDDLEPWMFQGFSLAPGFEPDPAIGNGLSGGPVDAAPFGTTPFGPCVGQVDNTPDHHLEVTAPFDHLRVAVRSEADTSLVVHGPDGWRCSDGPDPAIAGAWPSGRYEIYVGSRGPGHHRYEILLSQEAGP